MIKTEGRNKFTTEFFSVEHTGIPHLFKFKCLNGVIHLVFVKSFSVILFVK